MDDDLILVINETQNIVAWNWLAAISYDIVFLNSLWSQLNDFFAVYFFCRINLIL